jgi:hypothetical protein
MEKPIIFGTPMVQALLNTKPGIWPAVPIDPAKPYKCQTRRVVKPRYREGETGFIVATNEKTGAKGIIIINEEGGSSRDGYYNPPYLDDILWVRETWISWEGLAPDIQQYLESKGKKAKYIYRADQDLHSESTGWKPSIFLPHQAARLFLEVKSVRLERLQEISESDIKAEGITGRCSWYTSDCMKDCINEHYRKECYIPSHEKKYSLLWDSLNAKRSYGWESNPWVWVYEFMRIK